MLIKLFNKIKTFVLDAVFPIPEIRENIRLNQTLFCPTCRARQARNVKICHRDTPYKLGAATAYLDPVKKLIWRMKYRNKAGYAPILADLLCQYIRNSKLVIRNFIVVPLPLSEKRFRDRGYNQAALIGKIVSAKFNLEYNDKTLIRIKHAKPQAELKDWDERKKNIIGCFSVAHPPLIKNRNIIVIDDVFTSGATMSEAVQTLKLAGARRIIGLVVAKV
ncbi:MAG: ComF family protein [Candidatus Harrisonbacteria bacterium]|nr:ComF family protein [Candidatus Harrisonbacteria bacterium]